MERSIAEIAESLNEASLDIEETTKEEKSDTGDLSARPMSGIPEIEVKPVSGETKAKLTFGERAEAMGLHSPVDEGDNGVYEYRDRFSKVSFRQLYTTYDERVPIIGVYTGKSDDENYKYVGYVSDSYEFVGNDSIIDRIKNSINEAGETKIEEYHMMDPNYVQLHNELVISNGQNVPKVGDIYPQMVISNSYNGTKAVNVAFGLSISDHATSQRWGLAFRTKLGTMRQVHISSSGSTLKSNIGNYVENFQNKIGDLIETNFAKTFTDTDISDTLKIVEKLGIKKKDEISKLISDSVDAGRTSFWDIFNLIVKYSASQKNINTKVYLENVAERVLVIPNGMFGLIK